MSACFHYRLTGRRKWTRLSSDFAERGGGARRSTLEARRRASSLLARGKHGGLVEGYVREFVVLSQPRCFTLHASREQASDLRAKLGLALS